MARYMMAGRMFAGRMFATWMLRAGAQNTSRDGVAVQYRSRTAIASMRSRTAVVRAGR